MTAKTDGGTRDLERVNLRAKADELKSKAPAVFGPREIARLRSQAAGIVTDLLPVVREAAEGKRIWTPVQVQLFKTLWQSVMPVLSQSHSTVDVRAQNLGTLSREQIEELLAREVVDVTPD